MLNDKKLELIGIRMAHGTIFHSGMVKNAQDLLCVFVPLSALGVEQVKEVIGKYEACFEDMRLAGPKTINGYPTFVSVNFLTHEENGKVLTAYLRESGRIKELSGSEENQETGGDKDVELAGRGVD